MKNWKTSVKARVLRSKDIRKLNEKLAKEGYKVDTDSWFNVPSNTDEFWTTITNDRGESLNYNWSVGTDDYDDKLTHVWGISY